MCSSCQCCQAHALFQHHKAQLASSGGACHGPDRRSKGSDSPPFLANTLIQLITLLFMTSKIIFQMLDITRADGSKSPCVVPSILPGPGNKYGGASTFGEGAHSFSLSTGSRLACKHVEVLVKVGRVGPSRC